MGQSPPVRGRDGSARHERGIGAPSIVFWAVGNPSTASTRARVLAHRPGLEAAGFRVSVRMTGQPAGGRPKLLLARLGGLVRDVAHSIDADLLVLHRMTYPPPFARLLEKRQRCPIVFDLDDAIDLPPPSLVAGPRTRRRYVRNFRATTRLADAVLCGSPGLMDRVEHPWKAMIPTPVDVERFRPGAARPGDGLTLGWVGFGDNLRYLEGLEPVLAELARQHPALKVRVVSDRRPRLRAVPMSFEEWTLGREVEAFSGIDVGLAPLVDDAWTRCKCAYRPLQYMALGIPTVASPVGMNLDVVQDGRTGLLADTAEEWQRAIALLLDDRELARRVAAAARRQVVDHYSLQVTTPRLASELSRLLARRDGGDARG